MYAHTYVQYTNNLYTYININENPELPKARLPTYVCVYVCTYLRVPESPQETFCNQLLSLTN